MSDFKLKALVLSGDGINCERETCEAAREGGFEARIMHVNDLLEAKGKPLKESRLFVIPGGFSFGDELGSGQILALKLKFGLRSMLETFLSGGGGGILGICNGFQVLTRLGMFGSGVVLTQNAQAQFVNRWAGLKITGNSIFTDALKKSGSTRLELPIRHGEGRLVFRDAHVAEAAFARGECVLRYEEDVNGSWNQVAALSSYGGRVLGLMPHPEAFWTEELHPWGRARHVPLGVELFRNAHQALKGK